MTEEIVKAGGEVLDAALSRSLTPEPAPASFGSSTISIVISGSTLRGELRVQPANLHEPVAVEGFNVTFPPGTRHEVFEAMRDRWWELFRELERRYKAEDLRNRLLGDDSSDVL